MRVTLFTIGTRGNVRPCVALGRGFQCAGHEVVVATHTPHTPIRGFVAGHGWAFRPVAGNVPEVFQSEAVRRALRTTNRVAFLRDLTVDGLAGALPAATTATSTRRRAAAPGERIRAGDGVAAAAAACAQHPTRGQQT